MEDCSNSEPCKEETEKLFTSTQPDLEDTVNTGSESEPINHGTGLNGLSSIEELELSDKHTEDNMLSPTNMELRDGLQTPVALDHSKTLSGREPSSTETRTFKTLELLF